LKKILIVDDEPTIAATLDYVLRTDGFEPVCVGLGRLAIKEIKANEYALVILDIGLPDISGFDVCRELRTRIRWSIWRICSPSRQPMTSRRGRWSAEDLPQQ
jgi:DNA-binding response OmpR family regulator